MTEPDPPAASAEAPAPDTAGHPARVADASVVSADVQGKTRRPLRFEVQLLIIFAVACLSSLFVQFSPGILDDEHGREFMWRRTYGMVEGDSYYHIRMGWLYRTGEIFQAGNNFHWTRGSTWETHFSDKDFLYHLYLVPFTIFASHEADFDGLILAVHASIMVLCGLTAVALAVALRLMGVRSLWFFVLLAASAGGTVFVFRINEARSWVFSLIFSLLGWALMARRKHAWLFVLAVFYTLAYTASHLLLALCIFRAAGQFVLGPGKDGMASRKVELLANLKLAGVIAAGLFVGWALHPQPLELAQLWWVQNAMVLQSSTGGTHEGIIGRITALVMGYGPDAVRITVDQSLMGGELKPPPARPLLNEFPVLFAAPVLLPLAAAWFRWRPTREAVLVLAALCVFIAATLRSLRFIEYAGPWAALTWGIWVTGITGSRGVSRAMAAMPRLVRGGAIAAVLMTALLGINYFNAAAQRTAFATPGLEKLGEWMRENDAEMRGKVVFNHSWDVFPNLMFFYPHADYIVGLDPMYAAARADKKGEFVIHILGGDVAKAAGSGGETELWRFMRREFGAEYMLVTPKPYPGAILYFRKLVEEGKLKPIFDERDKEDFLFFRIPDVSP